jgi:hypothetical protein
MHRIDAYEMIRRRTAEAGFKGKLGCRVFPATGHGLPRSRAAVSLRRPRPWRRSKARAPPSSTTAGENEMTLEEVERIGI